MRAAFTSRERVFGFRDWSYDALTREANLQFSFLTQMFRTETFVVASISMPNRPD